MEMKEVLLVVPKDYKKVGGIYLTIDGYVDYLKPYYNIIMVEIPYHESDPDWNTKSYEIKKLMKSKSIAAVMTYGLNGSYMAARILDAEGKRKQIALIRDSNYFTVLSNFKYDHKLNSENMKDLLRLIPYKIKEKYCARNCLALVYASRWDAKQIKHRFKNIKARVVVQENGVYIPDNFKRKQHDLDREIVFGFMGSWTAFYIEHCIQPFLNICDEYLMKDYPQIKVILAGRGITDDHREYLLKYKYVEVMGEVDTLDDFFNSVDIIFTTVKKKSGILNKVLEAFSYGKCVIGFRDNFYAVKGSRDCVNCLFADNGYEFSHKLELIKKGTLDIDEIGGKARELIINKYTWEKKIGIIRNVIEYAEEDFI